MGSSTTKAKDKKKRKEREVFTAKTADRHILYQNSVQAPDFEVEFTETVYKRINGRRPLLLREDFCGSGLVCAEWVKSHAERRAIGLDIDRATLEWGREHNVKPLGKAASRVRLMECNVLDPPRTKVDVIQALNYSYFVFKTRKDFGEYLEKARGSLKRDGVMILDAYGGSESYTPQKEKRKIGKGKFTYVWDQASFNPINNHAINHIHFEFRDGSKIRRAFTYDWRLWQLIEIQELLYDVGFGAVDVFWEESDEDGEGNGSFLRRTTADPDPSWNAYIVARMKR
jgi:SAM-dependent methyltransferase